jgi:hypothetical protein
MKYLKDFSTESDYQAFKSAGDWATPNVSFINKDKRTFYNKKTIIFYTVQTIYNIKVNHQALPGMTWNDWVNSEYYTASSDGYFSNDDGFVRIEDSILKNSNGESVYMTDTIIPGETYTYRGTR